MNSIFTSKYTNETPGEVIRATETEKQYQIEMLGNLHKKYSVESADWCEKLKTAAANNENIFVKLNNKRLIIETLNSL